MRCCLILTVSPVLELHFYAQVLPCSICDTSLRYSLVLLCFCKEYISTTEKWLRKLYVYSNNINMSNEDNNHDTNYINKFHDANHDTRKLHL